MIVTTISNSMREKPFWRLLMIPPDPPGLPACGLCGQT
jgi:hypothetical protein